MLFSERLHIFVVVLLIVQWGNAVLKIEIKKFSRIANKQYYISSSEEIKNITVSTSLKPFADPQCAKGTLVKNICQEQITRNGTNSCPIGFTLIENSCIRFYDIICPDRYKKVEGNCLLDIGCDQRLHDQIGRTCYKKCENGYRRYYSNLCISEKPSCPFQFTSYKKNTCLLSQCPLETKLTADGLHCENICPENFKRISCNTCSSEVKTCPQNYEQNGDRCVQYKCKKGILLHGFCLDMACPDNLKFNGKVCKKYSEKCKSLDNHSTCPTGMIEIGKAPYMHCVMICPYMYAQRGKYCDYISKVGCPEGTVLFNQTKCIKESECPSNYEIFGAECIKINTYVGLLIKERNESLCPPEFVEYQDQCFKITVNACPLGMVAIEDSQYCVSTCPRGFYKLKNTCIASSNNCSLTQLNFMERCYEKCPFGTQDSRDTRNCRVIPSCESTQLFDLTNFTCVKKENCVTNSFVNPDGRFCHRKYQCMRHEYILDQYCVIQCPLYHHADGQFCKRIPSECPNFKLPNGTCVTTCGDGEIPKNGICTFVKIKIDCGLNMEMKKCEPDELNCIPGCICKKGFVNIKGICVFIKKETLCPNKHLMDLVFIIEQSKFTSQPMFNDVLRFVEEILTKLYSSDLNVYVGFIIHGPKNPDMFLLHTNENLGDILKEIHKIKYFPEAQNSSLVEALRITRKVIFSQCYGARIGSTRQIFAFGRLPELLTEKDMLVQEINFHKENGHVLNFITIKNEAEFPIDVRHLKVNSSNLLSQLFNKVFEITCGDIKCPSGYRKDGNLCIDKNECLSNQCHQNSRCINTPGSFVCHCPPNKVYLNSKKGCGIESKDCIIKTKIIMACDALVCKSPAKCANSNGMDFCICPRGYVYHSEDGCIDIDECLDKPCYNSSICKNTVGSFECLCPKGFEYNIHFGCIDINECVNLNICNGSGTCHNLIGSYNCSCNDGYQYKANEGCIDIDECQVTKTICKGDNVVCQNIPGSFKCICPKGFEYTNIGCIDINECNYNNTCHPTAVCVNLFGSFECRCNTGYLINNVTGICELDKSKNVTEAMVDFFFGVDVSDSMQNYLNGALDLLKQIISTYKLEFNAMIKRYFALTMGGNFEVKIIYENETDANVLIRTDAIKFIGGKSNLSLGLEISRNLYLKNSQPQSNKILIFITATKPSTYSKEEVLLLKKQIRDIEKDGRLLIIYLTDLTSKNEWVGILTEKEIEEHIVTVSQDFIESIYKLIYEKTNKLIKCPDGFMFLDKVCQYKTSKEKFCVWEDKLYTINSTWESSCATYLCSESGVTITEKKCMGFDGDCYKENEKFPCHINGKLNWMCSCKFSTYLDQITNKEQEKIDYVIIDFNKEEEENKVKLPNGAKCVFPFKYKNMWYYSCTDEKSDSKRWCGYDMNYVYPRFAYCLQDVKVQCNVNGKIYNDGETWTVGCNSITCRSGIPSVTARCLTVKGNCVALDTIGYGCEIDNVEHNSCICLSDNNGYGRNKMVSDKVTDKNNKYIGGKLVEFCVEMNSGEKFQVGSTWERKCIKMTCLQSGQTKIIDQKCESADGKCIEPGSAKQFSCDMNGKVIQNCQCAIENGVLVLISNEGGKVEHKTIDTKTIISSIS